VGGLFDEGREIGVGWKKLCFALGGTELCLFLEVGMFWGWRVGKFVRGTKVMTGTGWSRRRVFRIAGFTAAVAPDEQID
jgi:hypothetical protein